jgi:predicted RNase H-like HicB family nuclease
MNRIINFTVSKGEDGFYIASAEEEAIFTQGKTFEELVENIREAVEVSLDDSKESKSFPPVMMNMDFSKIAYA